MSAAVKMLEDIGFKLTYHEGYIVAERNCKRYQASSLAGLLSII